MIVKNKRNVPLRYGSDPEAFSVDFNGFAIPPYLFRKEWGVPATEDPKHPVFLTGDGWSVMEDGAAWEFTVESDTNPKALFDRIQECKRQLEEKILSRFQDVIVPFLQFLPTVGWEVERWKDMPEDFFMSTRFGCDPSKDAYEMNKVSVVRDASLHPYRYAGGHEHISGSPAIVKDPFMAVRCMAMTSGLAALAYSDVIELERLRTFQYGIPGNYRVQTYGPEKYGEDYAVGLEYRTPSCRWANDWNMAEKVFEWGRIGIENLLETGLGETLDSEISSYTCEAILQGNQNLAKELLSYVESKI